MKTRHIVTALALAAAAASAADLELLDGTILENARIRRAAEEGVTVFHASGVATVAWTNMPPEAARGNAAVMEHRFRESGGDPDTRKEDEAPTAKAGPEIVVSRRGNPSWYADRLKVSMDYLADIEEVRWVEIEHNTIYIGVDSLPNDAAAIVRGAALRGNGVIDFGCHVYMAAAPAGWRPGQPAKFATASARHGRVEEKKPMPAWARNFF